MFDNLTAPAVNRFGFLLGPDDVVMPPDPAAVGKTPVIQLFPFVSLLAVVLMLALLVPFRLWVTVPQLGMEFSFLSGAVLLWIVVLAITSFLVKQFPSASFGYLINSMNRGTGLRGIDIFGLVVAIIISISLVFTAPVFAPLAIYGLLAFVGFLSVPVREWPVAPKNARRESLPLPTIMDGSMATGNIAGKAFHWEAIIGPERVRNSFEIKIPFDMNRVADAQKRNPFNTPGATTDRAAIAKTIHELVIDGQMPEVVEIAAHLKQISLNKQINQYDEANNVLAFVHEFVYELDPAQKDYWRYPIETLNDERGDCDCCTVLALAIFYALGFDSIALLSNNHMACAVSGVDGFPPSLSFYRQRDGRNRQFFFCETTGENWFVGEIPAGTDIAQFEEFVIG